MSAHGETLDMYIAGELCGQLSEDRHGAVSFVYVPGYDGVPLSTSMPISLERYGDRIVRPYLMGLLPDEASTRSAIAARYGISSNNPFRLLGAIGMDCPGAVQVCSHGSIPPTENTACELMKLSDGDIEGKLAAVRENAAAAWVDVSAAEGHWSLGGCQAKFTLRREDGQWFDCSGAAASTHIVKPGVAGLAGQALVEFACMQLAGRIGLPVAKTEFCMFGAQPAIVIERYDRARDETGRVIRVHQEDFCQALGVMPDAKYAEQGGPATPRIVEMLKTTGERAKGNVYRFILYLFFNYLIGATDAHAKNHSLMILSPGDVRIAPLYDVASIAPYRSLSLRKRKPLRAALSIGGENRFGMLGSENVEKMVRDCGLEGLGLSSDLLCERLATMAELIPGEFDAMVAEMRTLDLCDSEVLEGAMREEIASNCKRVLNRLRL